jgi:hypothetical protein
MRRTMSFTGQCSKWLVIEQRKAGSKKAYDYYATLFLWKLTIGALLEGENLPDGGRPSLEEALRPRALPFFYMATSSWKDSQVFRWLCRRIEMKADLLQNPLQVNIDMCLLQAVLTIRVFNSRRYPFGPINILEEAVSLGKHIIRQRCINLNHKQ